MVKEIWKKVIWPVMAVLFLAMVFRPLCIEEDGMEALRARAEAGDQEA